MSVASDTQRGVDFPPKGLLTMKMCCADRGAGNHEAVCWGRGGGGRGDNVCRRSLAAPAHVCRNKRPPACSGGAPCPLLLPRKVAEGDMTWLQRVNRKLSERDKARCFQSRDETHSMTEHPLFKKHKPDTLIFWVPLYS